MDYTVKSGDNLWRITKNYFGDSVSDAQIGEKVNELSVFNNIDDPSTINIGQNIDMSCFEEEETERIIEDMTEESVENKQKEEAVTVHKKDIVADDLENENIDFHSGTPEDYEYANNDLKNKAQELWNNSQNSAIQDDKPRGVPTLDESGNVTANSEYYESEKEGPLSGLTVMVNAGHGGYTASGEVFDPGAVNEQFGVEEWRINQDYAEDLTEKLLDNGANVFMTQGYYKTLGDSIEEFADEFGNEDNSNLKLVSLHCNSGFENASGIVFFNSDGENKLIDSLNESAEEKSLNINGIQQHNTFICQTANENNIDNALVEIGFMSNPDELQTMLNDNIFKENFLDAMVEGLEKDKEKDEKMA